MKGNITTKVIEKTVEVYENVKCDNCSCDLHLVFNNVNDYSSEFQFKDALLIKLDGGYGMYFDPETNNEYYFNYLFCKKCTDELLEKFPCFKNIKE